MTHALPPSLLQSELQRILASAAFRSSPRHRRFLAYLVTHAVQGEAARLKEMTLGIDVFDRRASTFDPQSDTIVRVEARRLRARLARYYDDEGRRSLIEITLPTGAYVPSIRRREIGTHGMPTSLAILPITNATGDPALDASCDDLTDDLIDALARLTGIKVIAHHSVFRFRDAQTTADELQVIAKVLDVGLIVRGSLTRDASMLRLKLRLLHRRSEHEMRSVWSDAWLLARDGDFAARTALVVQVVDALHRRFVEGDEVATRVDEGHAPMSGDPRARELVDRGRYLMRQAQADAYEQSLARFREAVAIDPGCAPAHFGIARVQTHRIAMTLVAPADAIDEARESATRALALEPSSGEATSLLAALVWRFEHDWPRAHAGFLAAIVHAPGSLYVHFNYAFALLFRGRFDEAEAELRLARELDPLDIGLRASETLLPMYRRDHDRAHHLLTAVLEDEPRHLLAQSLLGAVHLYRDEPADALRVYRTVATNWPSISIGPVGVAQAHAMAGRPDEARAERDRLVAAFAGRYLSPYQLAMIAMRLGERDAVLSALARAADEHDPNFITIVVDPTFDAMRSDSDFRALLERRGLA